MVVLLSLIWKSHDSFLQVFVSREKFISEVQHNIQPLKGTTIASLYLFRVEKNV